MKCNLIGAGRLGKNIAHALSAAQIISSLSICNRTYASAQQACTEIGFGQAVNQLSELPPAEITWICSNDDALAEIATLLAQKNQLLPNHLIIHCSGVFNSSLLAPLKAQGAAIASMHPLKAFPANYLAADAFKELDCVIEGDPLACAWLQRSFTALGAYVSTIEAEHKAMYHAAACIASNYLITLAAHSEALWLAAGIQPQQSRRMLINLMQGNVSNLQHSADIAAALTGPLARGDEQTVALHLQALENPLTKHLYQTLGLATLPLTPLSEHQKEMMTKLLKNETAT